MVKVRKTVEKQMIPKPVVLKALFFLSQAQVMMIAGALMYVSVLPWQHWESVMWVFLPLGENVGSLVNKKGNREGNN